MSAPFGQPTLAELRDKLADAKRTRLCATMIDNTERMSREVAEADARIAAIQSQIDERQAASAPSGDWYFDGDRAAARGAGS